MHQEELEARVERLEKLIGQAPIGGMCEIAPTRENLLDFWKQFKEWRVQAFVTLKAKKS